VSDRRRLREIVATALLVLGGVGLVVASIGWSLERSVLDTSRFTGTANELLDQRAVQAELTHVIVRQLSREAGTDLRIAEPFLATIVTQVVESDPFRAVFDTALSGAHRVLVDRGTETIILDLTAAYDQIKGPLEQVAPKLAADLPSRRQLEVVLLQRSQLSTIWDAIDEVKRGVVDVTVAALVLLAAGVVMAIDRWRAVARGAWIVASAGATLVGALFVARVVVRSSISDGVLADAVVAAVRVITTPLVVQSIVVVALAIVTALAAGFTARAGLGAWRPAVGRAAHVLAGAVPSGGAVPGTAARLRLPPPRADSRRARVIRALALGAAGLVAVIEPDSVAVLAVTAAGVALLALAALEAVAARHAR
jgi:hypothetical protein